MSKLLTVLLAATTLSFGSLAGAQMTKEAREAESKKLDATYKADKERCDALSGNKKDVCVKDAKAAREKAKAAAKSVA